MGARNRNTNGVVVLARPATQPGGIGSTESILGLLKSLKIRAQATQPGGVGSLESILGLLKSLKFGLRLHSLEELVPWNRFLGSLKV